MAACAHLAAKAQSARGSLVGDGVKPDNEAEEEKREGTSEQDTAKDPVEDGHGSAEGTNADKEPKANGDIKIGEDSGKKTGTRSQTGEPSAPIPAEPKPFGKEGADWCITFHMTADLKKAVVAKVVQVDVRRALAQDLR